MRLLILSYLFLFTGTISSAQNDPNKTDYYPYYQFGNEYLNLTTLTLEKSIPYPAQTFKYTGKYAKRFERLAIDKLAYRGNLFEIIPNNGLKMTNMSSQISAILPNNEEGIERGGQNFMLSTDGGVIHVKHLNHDYGFMVYKYDGMGNEVFTIQLPHSEFVQKGNLEYHRPYLQYFAHSDNQIAFTSYDPQVNKTYLIDAETGKMSTEDYSVIGIVRSKDEVTIEGFVQKQSDGIKINVGNTSHDFPTSKTYTDCQTVWNDNQLAVALYNSNEGGCDVWIIDWASGNIAHTINVIGRKTNTSYDYYYNNVWISFFENKLLVEGFEKGGRYLNIYDGETAESIWNRTKN